MLKKKSCHTYSVETNVTLHINQVPFNAFSFHEGIHAECLNLRNCVRQASTSHFSYSIIYSDSLDP